MARPDSLRRLRRRSGHRNGSDDGSFLGDETFTAYGLTDEDVTALRLWSRSWADDLRTRVATEDVASQPSARVPDWDTYFDD
jgi:hypothetical protein